MSETMEIENNTSINSGPSGLASVALEQGPHLMRVADHSKMRSLVTFALEFLVTNDTTPLVLHTMPLAPSSTQGSSTEKQSKLQSRATREKCTTSVTKLISVVEIIKREFPKALRSHTVNTNPDSKGGASIAPELFDIHQYNEVGCIEDLYPSAEEETHEERAERITSLLQGKNHPAVKRTPYMKITLSRQPVPALAGGGSATYQAPIPFKYSKAQKARAKKRAAKLATATGSEGGELSETDRRPAAAVESIIGNTGSIVI